jgi:antitoxin component of RelBE/YafQ-DinJ toxin-antitoxin module
MNAVTINAKTSPTLKAQASQLADELGISLSIVINTALRNFVSERSIRIAEDYTPNKFLESAIASSRADYARGDFVNTKSTAETNALIDSL